jgi:hypothetical protein
METWTTVSHKKVRKDRPKGYITEEKAVRLQRELDIKGLARVLISTECRNIMCDGYEFCRVVKGDENEEEVLSYDDGEEYMWLPVNNEWKDRVFLVKNRCKVS